MSKSVSLGEFAADKRNFIDLAGYSSFARRFAEFRAEGNFQAEIVARRTPQYRFLQYSSDAAYQFTRPVNIDLLHDAESIDEAASLFEGALLRATEGDRPTDAERSVIMSYVYTMQQSIGAALDALPAGRSNTARKVNGDLFERLIQLIIQRVGVICRSGVIRVPVRDDNGVELLRMSYQHDLIMEAEGEIRVIGSVKTSSKDRMAKVFVDQFLYSRLTETETPHIAIFLNDVQRSGKQPNFSTSQTFLRGTFKGYTLKLNPLAGVYYADLLPVMRTDPLLAEHIHTLDRLLFDDLPHLLKAQGVSAGEVEVLDENPPELSE